MSQPSTTTAAPIEDTDARWPVMLQDWARHLWQRAHRGEHLEDWPPPWALPALSVAGLAVLVAVIAGLIVPLVAAIGRFLTAAFDDGADWVRDWSIARVVLDPVRTWLDTHQAGLPVDADTLWWTWSATGIALFALGWLFTANAARIGWILFGAATTAMVYTATTGPARPTAAAITILWWLLLSLAALRRRRDTGRIEAWLPQLPTLVRLMQRDDTN